MSYNFCLFFNFFVPKTYVFESFTWVIIHMDFVGFFLKTFKFKNDINYINYKFSHKFGKVCQWLNMYYLNILILIFFKVTIMSIWIILNNLAWTYKECKSANIEPLDHAFTFVNNVFQYFFSIIIVWSWFHFSNVWF
jgi:hypothetical protein